MLPHDLVVSILVVRRSPTSHKDRPKVSCRNSRADRGGADPLKAGCVTGESNRPFFFSTKLAPGAYCVTVTLGDAKKESTTTAKSETRRLMADSLRFLTPELLFCRSHGMLRPHREDPSI